VSAQQRCPRRRRPGAAASTAVAAAALLWALTALPPPVGAQRGGMFLGSADDPAIAYATAPLGNAVEALNRRLAEGSAELAFAGRGGYLASVLDALAVPVDSQLLLFSTGSLQGRLIGPSNPRALFFDDRVAVGWVRDGDLLELAAHDARAGVVFYTLEQRPTPRPVFKREFRCLGCHVSGDTLGVPGLLMFSSTPDGDGERHVKAVPTDHRNPTAERFGGWFVTGHGGAVPHRGNRVPALDGRPAGRLASTAGLFDADGFRAPSSDIAALLAFSHQAHMTNLLTRASWEARAADPAAQPGAAGAQAEAVATLMRGIAEEVVDYMLFVDEAPLPAAVRSGSGFAERMAARGPRDRKGRSLYELDLDRRLLKYPCSYLIYSPAFDALPPSVKAPIYRRMWQVLSGEAREPRYEVLSPRDRQAILEILEDTKPDLPAYFTVTAR
jgi:hypothetical protein